MCVLNLKGGAGKTMASANLACAWAAMGSRVLAVDLDPQASLLSWRARATREDEAVTVVGQVGAGLKGALRGLARGADVVVLDTPARLAEEARAALMVCSVALVPVTPGATDLWALEPTLRAIREARSLRKFAVWGLLNRADGRVYTRTMAADVEAMGLPLLSTRLRNYDAFPSAMADGESVVTWEPGSNAAHDVRRLATELGHHVGVA